MALSKPHATILLDNNDPSLIYGPGWMVISAAADIGGATAWADNSNHTYVACSFQGTSISFTGNTEGYWSNLTAIIDNGTPTNLSVLEDDPPQFYMAWYNSPILPDGNHTVNLTSLTGVALDYVTIEAGLNTPLSGSTLIVDDNDTAVIYTGGWIQSSQSYPLYGKPDSLSVMPYLNTTHYSNTVGDTASLAFTGTSISVYGVVSWSFVGSVSISFLLDGTFKSTYHLTSNGTDPQGMFHDLNNFQFFTTLSEAGSHVLEINVTENKGNQFFILDYFLYQPSFSTLAKMPNVTAHPSSPTPSFTLATSPHSPTQTISPTSYHAKSSLTISALIGSVTGGVIVIALFACISLYKKCSQGSIDTETGVKAPPCMVRGTQPPHVGVAPTMEPQRLSSPVSVNPLTAESEALRWRLLEFGRTKMRRASRSSANTLSRHTRQSSTYLDQEASQTSSPSNVNYIVPMQRETEEEM